MKNVVCWTVILLFCLGSWATAAEKNFPQRSISNVVVWPAGSRTDVMNRIVSAEMSKILGQRIAVVNRAGGMAGTAGMNYAYARPADGYTLCGLSEENAAGGVLGGWKQRLNVWDFHIIGGSPEVISLNSKTNYKGLKDLVAAARKTPKRFRVSVHYGSVHQLNLTALEAASGAKFQAAYFPDSAAAYAAAADGRAAAVIGPLADQLPFIRSGKLRPLAVLSSKPYTLEGFGKIPTATAAIPELAKQRIVAETIAFGVSNKTPASVKQTLNRAFEKALVAPMLKSWAKEHATLLNGKTGKKAGAEFALLEAVVAWSLWDQGRAKVDPKSLGIPKP
jgi:tripartite-type tricarboxylate transporter receptor subunit TctC